MRQTDWSLGIEGEGGGGISGSALVIESLL